MQVAKQLQIHHHSSTCPTAVQTGKQSDSSQTLRPLCRTSRPTTKDFRAIFAMCLDVASVSWMQPSLHGDRTKCASHPFPLRCCRDPNRCLQAFAFVVDSQPCRPSSRRRPFMSFDLNNRSAMFICLHLLRDAVDENIGGISVPRKCQAPSRHSRAAACRCCHSCVHLGHGSDRQFVHDHFEVQPTTCYGCACQLPSVNTSRGEAGWRETAWPDLCVVSCAGAVTRLAVYGGTEVKTLTKLAHLE